ncbi:response regulator [Nocardiopsis suaedae]|uniref:Response regulator transcription factor n=1 Tax=Nocardiopsis suaedae TaxID=3018444 RepID=A0ABT4TXC5_9ACTN|nr:response regulator transcription factor [Nocardiopsis suaedae]MDA2808782.1 response regulator transcription factor [Nocardiopsis suaedae]
MGRSTAEGTGEAGTAIRVVLADDERMVRAGLCAILGADPGIEVVGEASDGAEAVALVREHRPDVALLDVQMPGTDGLEAAEAIMAEQPGTAVVILTTFSEDAYIARALSCGAGGFVLKTGDPRELLAGLRAVVDGGAYLSPEVARRVITELGSTGTGGRMSRGAAARERTARLSDREREVLAHLGEGLSNEEIAGRLGIVPGTVKVHVGALLSRLGVRNRVQAAILAYEAGLVSGVASPGGGASPAAE